MTIGEQVERLFTSFGKSASRRQAEDWVELLTQDNRCEVCVEVATTNVIRGLVRFPSYSEFDQQIRSEHLRHVPQIPMLGAPPPSDLEQRVNERLSPADDNLVYSAAVREHEHLEHEMAGWRKRRGRAE